IGGNLLVTRHGIHPSADVRFIGNRRAQREPADDGWLLPQHARHRPGRSRNTRRSSCEGSCNPSWMPAKRARILLRKDWLPVAKGASLSRPGRVRSGIKPRRAYCLGGVGVVRRDCVALTQKEIPVTPVQRNGTTPLVSALST